MRKNQREGYSQSYNTQVVVDAEGKPVDGGPAGQRQCH